MKDTKLDQLRVAKQFVALLSTKQTFKVGDVVEWKSQEAKNKKMPDLWQKAVVSYIYPEPQYCQGEGGSSYDFEPITFRLAFIDKDGDMMEYPYDSRRFRLAD